MSDNTPDNERTNEPDTRMTDPQITDANLDARIAQLPEQIVPDAALWQAIAGQLDAVQESAQAHERAPDAVVPIAQPRQSTGSSWYEMAAAAAFAAVTCAFIAWGQLASTGDPDIALARLAPFEMSEQHGGELIRVRQQLHNELRRALEELSPATRVVVVENLSRIELARAEIESALEEEPGNRLLEQLLLTSYTNELTLLNEFTTVARSAQQRTRL